MCLRRSWISFFHTHCACGLLESWQMQPTMLWKVSYRSFQRSSFPFRRCSSLMHPSAHYRVAPIRPMNHVGYAMCDFAVANLVDAKLATRGCYAVAA